MKLFRITVAGALVLFAVTAGFAMSVKSDYQKNFDFTQLHTFAFKTDRASNDPLSTNTLEAGRIQNALAAQLETNGFTQAAGSPDFIVAFYSRTKEKTRVQSTGGFGPGLGAGFGRFGFGRGFGWGYGIPGRGRWRWSGRWRGGQKCSTHRRWRKSQSAAAMNSPETLRRCSRSWLVSKSRTIVDRRLTVSSSVSGRCSRGARTI